MIQQNLQTGNISSISNVPPAILKKLIEERIKRNKEEPSQEESQIFEVNLVYHNASEKMRVKTNSFQNAARNALMRRQNSKVPERITIKRIQHVQ